MKTNTNLADEEKLRRWIEIKWHTLQAPLEINIRFRPWTVWKYFKLILNVFKRPQLYRQMGPGQRPQAEHEFKKIQLR